MVKPPVCVAFIILIFILVQQVRLLLFLAERRPMFNHAFFEVLMLVSLTDTTLPAGVELVVFVGRVAVSVARPHLLFVGRGVSVLDRLLTAVQHVDDLEDFVGLEVVHLFQGLDVLRDVREPADRHRHFSRSTCAAIRVDGLSQV